MDKTKAYLNVFTPSGIGIVLYAFLSGLVLLLHQFEIVQRYLYLPSQVQIQQSVTLGLDRFLTTILGQAKTETFVVGLFWAVVGLFVYIFLRGVTRLLYEIGEDLEERRFVWPKGTNRYKPLELFAERALFRVAVIIGLVFYVFYPASRVIGGPVFVNFIGTNVPLQYILWFVCLVLIMHGGIVLLRLLVLRERLIE